MSEIELLYCSREDCTFEADFLVDGEPYCQEHTEDAASFIMADLERAPSIQLIRQYQVAIDLQLAIGQEQEQAPAGHPNPASYLEFSTPRSLHPATGGGSHTDQRGETWA